MAFIIFFLLGSNKFNKIKNKKIKKKFGSDVNEF